MNPTSIRKFVFLLLTLSSLLGLGHIPVMGIEECLAEDYEAIGSPKDEVFLTNFRLNYNGQVNKQFIGEIALTPNPDKSDLTAPFIFYKSYIKGPRPVVIIPPSLEGVTIMERGVGVYLASKGINAIVFRPKIQIQDPQRQLDEIDGTFKVAVFSLKMLIDWVHTRPDLFDANRIGVFGMSLGGILSSIILGQDSRVKAGYLVVAGGDLPSILARGRQKFLDEYRRLRMKDEKFKTVKEYEEALRRNLSIDPLTPAFQRNPNDVFMVMGGADKVVPYRNQKKLWESMGKPKYAIFPRLDHALAVATVPFSLGRIIRHMFKNWHEGEGTQEL